MPEFVQWSAGDKAAAGNFLESEKSSGPSCPGCGRKGYSLHYTGLTFGVEDGLWRQVLFRGWPRAFADLRHLALHEEIVTWLVGRGHTGFGFHEATPVSQKTVRAISHLSLHETLTPETRGIIARAGIQVGPPPARMAALAQRKPRVSGSPRYYVVEPQGVCHATLPEGPFLTCEDCGRTAKKVPGSLARPLEVAAGNWDGRDLVRETALYPWLKFLRREVAEAMKVRWPELFRFSGGVYGLQVGGGEDRW